VVLNVRNVIINLKIGQFENLKMKADSDFQNLRF